MAGKEAAVAMGPTDQPPPYPSQPTQPYPQQGMQPYPQQGMQPYPQYGAPAPHGAYPPSQPAYYPPSSSQMQSSTNVVVAAPSAPQQTVIIRESAPTSPTSMDVTGLILGICSLLCCVWPIGLISVILSGIAMCSRSDGKQQTADTLTKVSLGLSIASAVLGVIIIIVLYVYVWS
ncbi:cysteine-rich and transmembrane domain-containing protein 1-like isoform X2 [Ptychodera flava]|uniref:cysteine-rich and transmembrane domain-containing protein 1-like isoform X2 n=1 Tax=Ptychodera flava TaxID=63121 RepID=UPI003969F22F